MTLESVEAHYMKEHWKKHCLQGCAKSGVQSPIGVLALGVAICSQLVLNTLQRLIHTLPCTAACSAAALSL